MSKKAKKRASGAASMAVKHEAGVQRAQTSSGEFNPDYSYVKKDLRRIAGLAIFFFVVLIALSFILR